MNILRIILPCAMISLSCLTTALCEVVERTLRIPVLTVGDEKGELTEVELTYYRNPTSRAPLSVSIAEDTPNGSGETLRASIWQAAMVAAMERRDPMLGVQLKFSISGSVDGPSAGGALCLGIMSALDGRDLPSDFAMTGTILPDGSIGRVGGVHYKTMAAHQAGKTKILEPDCLRLVYDEVRGIWIDLKVLANTLGLNYIPVSSISEAYRAVHSLPSPAPRSEDEIELPDAMEDYCRTLYNNSNQQTMNIITNWPAAFLENMGPVYQTMLIGLSDQADQAALAGYYDVAASSAQAALFAAIAYEGMMNTLYASESYPSWEELESLIKKYVDRSSTPLDLVESLIQTKMPLSGMQHLGDITFGAALAEYIKTLGDTRIMLKDYLAALGTDSLLTAITPEGAQRKQQRMETESGIEGVEGLMLFLALLNDGYHTLYEKSVRGLCEASDDHRPRLRENYAGTENLIFSSLLATFDTVDREVASYSAAAGMSADKFYEDLLRSNPDYTMALNPFPVQFHAYTKKASGTNAPLISMIATMSYIQQIATMDGLLTAYGELDARADDSGKMTYGRSGLLHELLRKARRRALEVILECRDAGLPWEACAMTFREADFNRDAADSDKVEVLTKYWEATLRANAIRMLFSDSSPSNATPAVKPATYIEIQEIFPTAQPEMKKLTKGDMLLTAAGVSVSTMDELIFVTASMPKDQPYKITYASKDGRETKEATLVGGQKMGMLGVDKIADKPSLTE